MNINYTIDTQRKIIFEVWSENVSFNDYRDYKARLYEDPVFNPSFDVISDIRKYSKGFSIDAVEDIIKLFLDHPDKTQKRKSALVTNDPKQVAGSMIFQTKSDVLPIQVLVFSTIEAALEWILGKSDQ